MLDLCFLMEPLYAHSRHWLLVQRRTHTHRHGHRGSGHHVWCMWCELTAKHLVFAGIFRPVSRSGCQRCRGTQATRCSFCTVWERRPGTKKKKSWEAQFTPRVGANDIIKILVWTDSHTHTCTHSFTKIKSIIDKNSMMMQRRGCSSD